MPAGLQVWLPDGTQVIDTSTYIGRTLVVVDASAINGSVTVAGLDQGIPFAIPVLHSDSGNITVGAVTIPQCTFSGTTLTWTRQAPPVGYIMPGCTLIMGVR